jgi:hypothetical protein
MQMPELAALDSIAWRRQLGTLYIAVVYQA